MLNRIFAAALAMCPLTAAAGQMDFQSLLQPGTEAKSEDFSAQAVYRIEFGGARAGSQGLHLTLRHSGLRTALIESQVGAHGLQRFAVNGLDLTTTDPALGQAGKTRYFLNLTGIQWLGIGVASLALVAVVAGSGGGGGDEPRVGASGGG